MDDTNMFGGAVKTSMYTPLSEVEQECLSRLIEGEHIYINIPKWGHVLKPQCVFGDLRVKLTFEMTFNRPETPMVVPYFDFELKTRDNILLFKDRQHTLYNGEYLKVQAGVCVVMEWHIALNSIHPSIVKRFVPMARGLTSRFQDRDTKEFTLQGNTNLSATQQAALYQLRQNEKSARQETKTTAKKATKAAKYE